MLEKAFQDKWSEVRKSSDDADTLIMQTDVEKACKQLLLTKIVDLLMLLIALSPLNKDVFFLELKIGKVISNIFSSQHLKSNLLM